MVRFDQRICEMIKRFNALQATAQSKAEVLNKLQMEYNLMTEVIPSLVLIVYVMLLL